MNSKMTTKTQLSTTEPEKNKKINKATNNKCRRGCGEKGTLVQLVGMQTGAATVENTTEFPRRTKNGITF